MKTSVVAALPSVCERSYFDFVRVVKLFVQSYRSLSCGSLHTIGGGKKSPPFDQDSPSLSLFFPSSFHLLAVIANYKLS